MHNLRERGTPLTAVYQVVLDGNALPARAVALYYRKDECSVSDDLHVVLFIRSLIIS